MPHDRRTRRVLLAMMGLIGVAMSVGCMRLSNLRSPAGSLPALSPAGDLHPDAGGTTPGTSSPMPAPQPDSAGRDLMATQSRPALDLPPNTGGSAASPSQGIPATSPAPGATTDPATPVGASPPPASDGATTGTAPEGSSSTPPAPAGNVPGPPATSPTPLLDAEIRRAESVTRQHFESIGASATTAAADPVQTPPAQPTPAEVVEPKPADRDLDLDSLLPPLAASARSSIEPAAPGSAPKIALPPFMPIDPIDAGSATGSPPREHTRAEESPSPQGRAATAMAEIDRHGAPPVENESGEAEEARVVESRAGDMALQSAGPTTEPDRTRRPPLEIVALRLCSRVKGFGSFEPVDADTLQAGRRIRVYWEMAGLDYEARGDVFVSRLAAHLELRSETDGSVVWEQSPQTAEDVCPHRRRDYYASIPVDLPSALKPGSYRLRLIQTDLVGNRAASREIPVTIVLSAVGSR
jgi:hypothetical protein